MGQRKREMENNNTTNNNKRLHRQNQLRNVSLKIANKEIWLTRVVMVTIGLPVVKLEKKRPPSKATIDPEDDMEDMQKG
jgi:hypothetical protein